MNIFSFRAECPGDVHLFLQQDDILFSNTSVELFPDPDSCWPDVEVEMVSDLPLAKLLREMRCVVDGHVMVETLRPVPRGENSMERNHDQYWATPT